MSNRDALALDAGNILSEGAVRSTRTSVNQPQSSTILTANGSRGRMSHNWGQLSPVRNGAPPPPAPPAQEASAAATTGVTNQKWVNYGPGMLILSEDDKAQMETELSQIRVPIDKYFDSHNQFLQSNDGKAASLNEEGAEPSHCPVRDGNHLYPLTPGQTTTTRPPCQLPTEPTSQAGNQDKLDTPVSNEGIAAARVGTNLAGYAEKTDHSASTDKKDIDLVMYERYSDQTIYTFFDNFEAYHGGNNQIEKARALYKRYLHSDLKYAVEECKDDYLEMKAKLMNRFGSKHIAMGAIAKKMITRLSATSSSDRAALYRVLAGIWRELMELANRPETAQSREQYLARYADNEFILKFVVHLNGFESQKWTSTLKAAGLNPHHLHGMEVFDQLGSFLKEQVLDYAAEDEAVTSLQLSPSRTPKQCGLPPIIEVPVFRKEAELSIDEFFESFEHCFEELSLEHKAFLLLGKFIDPALRIDLPIFGYDFYAVKNYMIERFRKVSTPSVPVCVPDPGAQRQTSVDTTNQILSVPSDDTSKKDNGKFAIGSGCVRKGMAPKQHSKQASLQLEKTSVSDRVDIPTSPDPASSARCPLPSPRPRTLPPTPSSRTLPSVPSNNTHREKDEVFARGPGSVRKGIAPKQHSKQTSLQFDRTSVFDRVKSVFMILTACFVLKNCLILTTFNMDYGNLDFILPWMDNNYRNSNLRFCFPLEKNIASPPVDVDYGILDFIVTCIDNNYRNSNLRFCFPLEKNIASPSVENFSFVFFTLLIYLFGSIELDFLNWAKLMSFLTLLGRDFGKTISGKWNVQSLSDSVQFLVRERPRRRQHPRQRRRRRHRARRCGPCREWIAPLDHQCPSLMPGCFRIWNTGYWLDLVLKYTPIRTLSRVGGECVSQVFKHAMPICSRGLQSCRAALSYFQDCAGVWTTTLCDLSARALRQVLRMAMLYMDDMPGRCYKCSCTGQTAWTT